jgi:hypothetical protein
VSAPRPAPQPPGIIVRIRVTGCSPYASKRMTLDEARLLAAQLTEKFRRYPEGLLALPEFPCPDLECLSVNASRVVAVEVHRVTGDGRLLPRGGEPVASACESSS